MFFSKKLFMQLHSLEIFLEKNLVTYFFKKTKATFPMSFLNK